MNAAAAFVLAVLAVLGGMIFTRMGMLRDYLIALTIAAALLALIFVLDTIARGFLHI